MKRNLTLLLLLISALSFYQSADACNWKSRYFIYNTYDSCNSNSRKASVGGYVFFNSNLIGCFKYQWKVNGNVVSSRNVFSYTATQNGSYTISCKVTDTCNNCDTIFSSTKTISCLPNCNWKNKYPTLYTVDSCDATTKKASVFGYISFNSNKACFKYQWKVNGVNSGNNYYMSYPVNSNGTYTVCVKVTDTCNNCDTTFCSTKTISCLNSCNWKNRNPYSYSWDTCQGYGLRNSVNGYISFQYNSSCFKYNWTVNGKNAGNSYWVNYPITQNGTYYLCVKVTDTCNRCDTTFCMIKTINCFKNCNWSNKITALNYIDSCNGRRYKMSLNGYVAINQNYFNCCKFLWKVDGQIVSNNNYFHAPINKNGNYNVCVKITDTCNNCDTIICVNRLINCSNSGIEPIPNKAWQSYPNPVQTILNLETESNIGYLKIFNSNGQLIYEANHNELSTKINVSTWPAGIYLLRREDTGQVLKFIKQ